MIRVSSYAISAIGYDPQSRRMKIAFTQGHTYDFCDVSQNVFDGLLRASSKGATIMITSRTPISVELAPLRGLTPRPSGASTAGRLP
jgi:hypothetical protein